MKYVCFVVAILGFVLGTDAFADDGNVPKSVLAKVGLARMETVSDEVGMQVRGRGGNAFSMGRSLVSGLLITPDTKNFVFGSDANLAIATAENAGVVDPVAAHNTQSAVALQLIVVTNSFAYNGFLIGAAGGFGVASSQ